MILDKCKQWLRSNTYPLNSFPEFMVRRMYISFLLFVGAAICVITFLIVNLTKLYPVLFLIMIFCAIEFLRNLYIGGLGKWQYIEGICITDTTKMQLRKRRKIQIKVPAGENQGIYMFTTSKHEDFNKGCTVGVYTQNVDFLEINGIYHLPLLYRIEIK